MTASDRRTLLKILTAFSLLPFAARAQQAAITITLGRNASAAPIPPGFAGFSYEKSHLNTGFFTAANAPLIALFRRLGPGLLRLGGNSVDKTNWMQNGAGNTAGQVAPADITALAAFLRAANWKALYGLNLASNTPDNLVAEAVTADKILGPHLAGFEIGNEPDLFPANGNRPATYTLGDFEREWKINAAALKAKLPRVLLTGPGSGANESSWTVPFARDASGISLLTQHYYRANGRDASSTLALLLAGDTTLPAKLAQLRDAATATHIPWRMAEANSFFNGGAPGVSNNFGTALWAIDFLALNAQYGAAGVNFHTGGAAPGYTPIADTGREVVEVRPEYYGLLLFALAAKGRPLAVTFQAPDLSAYAFAEGARTRILILNKHASKDADISLALGASSATLLALRAPSLDATSGVTLGGAPVNADGSWHPAPLQKIRATNGALRLTAPAASALLITF